MFQASFDGESVFSIETAFNPFKSYQSQGGLKSSKENDAISQQNKPFYDRFGKVDPKEHVNPSFPHSESLEADLIEYPSNPKHKLQPCVVSKLPDRVGKSLGTSAPARRSSSLLTDAACYTPTSTSSKKSVQESSSKPKDDALHLAMQGIQTMDMSPIVNVLENENLPGDVLEIVQVDADRRRSIERTHSAKANGTFRKSPTVAKLPMSMSPQAKGRRDADARPPAPRSSPISYIPLPPFSSRDDHGKELSMTSKAVDASSSPSSFARGRGMAPRPRKHTSRSPAGSPREGRPKAPMREGVMLSPAKSQQLLQLSGSSRVRSQSPRISKSAMDRTNFGIPAGCSREAIIISDMKPPSTPKRISKSLRDECVFNDMKPPVTPKRKAKSLKDANVFGSVKAPSTPKQKSNSLKDERVFSVIWQRLPGNSSNSEGSRSSSEPPVPTSQRRLVGGASRRVRVDEISSSRNSKEHGSNVASHCRRSKGGRISDPKKQLARSDNHSVWDECKSRSNSVTRTPKKVVRHHETAFVSTLASPDRFDATPNHSDIPPMSPFRRGTDVDLPPTSPIRKISLKKMNSLPSCSDDDSGSFRNTYLPYHQFKNTLQKDGNAFPPRQSRRRSCF
jgi:hypothetical protein